MRLGYFVNQYPKVSHTFIRREIAAIESQGVPVARYALRALAHELVDPADKAELTKTREVLGAGAAGLLAALLKTVLGRPAALLSALRLAWQLGSAAPGGRIKHLVYLLEACVLRGWLADDGITHLHVHFGTNSAAVALLCRRLGGPGYSFTVHGPEEFDLPAALSLATKMHEASAIVAISSFCRSQLFRWAAPALWPRIHVVRCALDPADFAQPPAPVPSAARFICVGRLSPEKGQALLLQAVKAVCDRGIDLHLTLAGDGPSRADLEATIARFGLQQQVTITGWVTNQQVREGLAQSRALVLPSFAEGLPVVIMEAFAARRPVLSTYVAGIPELVEPGRSGWLVPAGDVDQLTEALAAAASASPQALAAMGDHGHARAAALHNAMTEAAKLKSLFATL